MALNGLFCADVPLRNYSLTHSPIPAPYYCQYIVKFGFPVPLSQLHTSLESDTVTINRSSTASALSCLTVTAVLPYVMFLFPRYYRTRVIRYRGNTAYLFKNFPITTVLPHKRYPLPR